MLILIVILDEKMNSDFKTPFGMNLESGLIKFRSRNLLS